MEHLILFNAYCSLNVIVNCSVVGVGGGGVDEGWGGGGVTGSGGGGVVEETERKVSLCFSLTCRHTQSKHAKVSKRQLELENCNIQG